MEGAMLIAISEGRGCRFEVDESVDGFLVSMRDLETGEENIARLFRTAPAAFAFAELAAAQDRCREDDPFERDVLRASEARFATARRMLCDEGVSGELLEAWRNVEAQERSIRYH
jgi:hypothetical protein